ncbi:TonB-linked SusC/RagA family outer membrane protein [Maribacter vaceletii]|uniref:TonB-linked SusC/RagA family outer membrane protein n=1 Tax=Maribacter vaceletii TaxID=1206816 RepID=A0A495ECF9_9FLAO|nr:TonB-dependent receptor [Maribacter vaceletii]RKR14381.1 TonB-linked SusC/RagA family outer membrane protein [Maribacter vaceletii]
MKKRFNDLLRNSFLSGLFLMFMGIQFSYAQQTVTGTVTDELGPVAGANIVIKGTTNGTQTDFDGNFTISASSSDVLVISYLGYATQSVPVGDKNTLNVKLEEDASQLEEVIVIGYGTAKKSDLTGAVSRVTTESFEAQPITRVEEALQGRASGVTVAKANGQPGGAIKVRVRGVNSIDGDNSPLVVIDGIQGGDLTSLNPNDIASMDILKDASATAIYGVRGSNGVIIITTKRGSGKGKIAVDFFTTVSSTPEFLPTLADNPDQFAIIENARRVSTGGSPIFSDQEIADLASNGGTNYQDEILRTGISKNLQISASGSEGNISYFLSGNYRDEEGIVINTGFQQLAARSNLSAQVSDKLKVSLNIAASRGELKNDAQALGNGQGSFMYKALTWDPTTPVFDADGNYNLRSLKGIASLNDNPVRTLNETDITDIRERLSTALNVSYNITDNFTYTFVAGTQLVNNNRQRYAVEVGDDQLPHTSFFNNKTTSYQITNIFTWNKNFNDLHNLKLTGVQEYSNSKFIGNNYEAENLPAGSNGFYFAELATGLKDIGNTLEPRELSSYMLRAEYILADDLFLTATGRYDASSVFRETSRWGFFPSVALAYSLNDLIEDSESISSLKLRAGWGQVGNQNVDPFDTYTTLTTNAYSFDGNSPQPGARLDRVGNPDLTWETTSQVNVGIDLGFQGGRGNITLEGYKKVTEDILLPVALPETFGGNNSQITVSRNVGEVENVGFDLTLGYDIIATDNLNWNSNFSLSYVKNEVTSLYDGLTEIPGRFTAPGGQGNILNGIEVGQPLGQFFGATFLGTWKSTDNIPTNSAGNAVAQPGDAKYLLDENNDIVFSSIGNGTPDLTWGFNNSVNYKAWDINIFLQGVHGFDVYNVMQGGITGGAGDSRSFLASDHVNAWTPTNETDIPATAQLYGSSRYVEKGDFIRLSNLSVGYTMKDVAGLENTSVKIYASGQNLFLITDYSGFDPEATSRRTNNQGNSDAASGINIGAYPNPRTLSLGVKVGF